MLAKLLEPKPDLAALILRVGLAAVFIVHGNLKVSVDFLVQREISLDTQRLVGWTELACGVLLLVGLLGRLAALAVIVMQSYAIALVSGKHALDLVRTTLKEHVLGVGPEYNLVLICMCLGVIVLGSGRWSIDHLLAQRWRRPAPAPATGAPVA
ncbi:MAG: DoxX family protein [Gemmataceae bacterium]|nr:DoxX family protein [Gemmataceae bacterium]